MPFMLSSIARCRLFERLSSSTFPTSVRCPLVDVHNSADGPNVDGFTKLPQSAEGKSSKDDPAYVAATLTATALHFRDQLIAGTIKPDGGAAPQDMEQYKWFGLLGKPVMNVN